MPNKQTTSTIFKNFNEYWHFARHLSQKQRRVVFDSLPKNQQKTLNISFLDGKWEDVFHRNSISELIDSLKNKYGYDLLEIKCKAISGKSVYVPKSFWDAAIELIGCFETKHTNFAIGGIKAIECSQNKNTVLIISASSELKD